MVIFAIVMIVVNTSTHFCISNYKCISNYQIQDVIKYQKHRGGYSHPMPTIITKERPDTPDAISLILELEALLESLYPPASRHGFSVEKLIAEDVAFFLLRTNEMPACCGGIQLVGSEYGEIKRMYVRPQFRGVGFAKLMLNHLADYAQAHNIRLLRLETGIYQQEAIGLYEQQGFYRIPPFGTYIDDPLSLFYEKRLM
jgi:putative acetyltransferase